MIVANGAANDGEPTQCDLELSIPVELDLQIDKRISQTTGWFARRRLTQSIQKMRPELEEKIRQLCTSYEKCSVRDVTAATALVLAESTAAIAHSALQQKVRQYGLLVAALASNTALQLIIGSAFSDKTAALLASNITTITTVLVFSLGAPVLERLENRVRQWALQNPSASPLHPPGNGPHNAFLPRFEQTYWESQAYMGIPGSAGRSLNRAIVNEVRYPLSMAATMAQLDPLHGMEKAAALVAQLLFDLRAYPEFDSNRFSSLARTWFGNHYVTSANFEAFVNEVLLFADTIEPGAVSVLEIRERYVSILYSWFRPRLRTQILGE